MDNFSLIRNILAKDWAIDPFYISTVGTSLMQFLEKGVTYNSTYDIDRNISSNYKDVQIIEVNGELLKNDTSSGRMGMSTMAKLITSAEDDEDISGTILLIDSPGGTVDGTMELVKAIKSTNKPTVTVIDGMAASAAYWIASATDRIFALNKFNKLGSIGVMLSFADVQPYYEKQGVKFHRIYADQSQDKNKMFEDLLNGNYEEYIKTNLNPIAEEFISSVKNMRPLKEGQYSGKTFFAKDVIGSMIDEIGSMDDAVNYIKNNSNSNTMFGKDKDKNVTVTGNELAEKLNDAQNRIQELEKELGSRNETFDKLNAEKTALEEQNKKLSANNYELEQQLVGSIAEIEKLKQQDGDDPSFVQRQTDAHKTGKQPVFNSNASLLENVQKVTEAYLN